MTVEPVGNDDIFAALTSPDGTKLQEGRGLGLPYFSLAAIAGTPGMYKVEVRSPSPESGIRYRIQVDGVRPATAQDPLRVAAWAAVLEGNRQQTPKTALAIKPREPLLEAVGTYQKALPDFRSLNDRRGEAAVLYALGVAHWQLQEYSKCLGYFSQAQAIWRDLGDTRAQRDLPSWFGVVYRALGKFDESLAEWEKALAAARANQDRPEETMALAQFADTYAAMGDHHRQIETLNQALLLEQDKHGPMESILLARIGSAYTTLHEYPAALYYFERVLAIQQSRKVPLGIADVLGQIAEVHQALGETQKALECYQESVALRQRSKAPGRGSGDLWAIGSIYADQADYPRALEYLNQALAIIHERKNVQFEAFTLVDIGKIHAKMGQKQTAIEYFEKALQVWPETPDHRTAVIFNWLGSAYHAIGENRQALGYYQKALALGQPFSSRAWEAGLLASAAQVERDLGDLGKARAEVESALALYESIRAQLHSPDLRASYFTGVRQYYEFYVDLLMQMHAQEPRKGYAAEALQASERGRARSLLEILAEARADIRQGADPQLLERDRALQRRLNAQAEWQRGLLGGSHTQEQAESAAAEIRRLTAELQEVQARIRLTSPRYAALTQPAPLTHAEIQRLLDPETLLLEYSLGEQRSYLWAATADSITSFQLPPRAEIETSARRVYELVTARGRRPKGETGDERRLRLSQAEAEYPKAAAHLSRLILGPARALLGSRRLLVVSDGALEYVPFPGLPVPETAEPLILRHETVRLPSASVLAEVRREVAGRKPAPKAVAVLADPVFDRSDERLAGNRDAKPVVYPKDLERSLTAVGLAEAGWRIPRLPFSRREAKSIASFAPPGAALINLDFQANRATGASPKLAQYRIVHFATHGLLNSENPALSGIVLSMVDERGAPQNGFLRLHEIYNLNLPADLVVLSACQTGLGKEVKGEGLVGLTRGFMYAGAARVAASLWKVDDAATAELMARLYQGLLIERQRPAAALRAAQLDLRKQPRWQSPYYWAGFELQGEWK